MKMKRVAQYSVDIRYDDEKGDEPSLQSIQDALESAKMTVLGVDFKDDLTVEYEANYRELLED